MTPPVRRKRGDFILGRTADGPPGKADAVAIEDVDDFAVAGLAGQGFTHEGRHPEAGRLGQDGRSAVVVQEGHAPVEVAGEVIRDVEAGFGVGGLYGIEDAREIGVGSELEAVISRAVRVVPGEIEVAVFGREVGLGGGAIEGGWGRAFPRLWYAYPRRGPSSPSAFARRPT